MKRRFSYSESNNSNVVYLYSIKAKFLSEDIPKLVALNRFSEQNSPSKVNISKYMIVIQDVSHLQENEKCCSIFGTFIVMVEIMNKSDFVNVLEKYALFRKYTSYKVHVLLSQDTTDYIVLF